MGLDFVFVPSACQCVSWDSVSQSTEHKLIRVSQSLPRKSQNRPTQSIATPLQHGDGWQLESEGLVPIGFGVGCDSVRAVRLSAVESVDSVSRCSLLHFGALARFELRVSCLVQYFYENNQLPFVSKGQVLPCPFTCAYTMQRSSEHHPPADKQIASLVIICLRRCAVFSFVEQ